MIRTVIHSWLHSEETKAIVEEALSDRRLSKSEFSYNLGGLPAVLEHYEEETTPAILIAECAGGTENVLELTDRFADVCDPGTNVILLGADNDITLYRSLIKRGVSEYILSPITPRQIYDAVMSICLGSEDAPKGKSIGFYSARGGAGGSSIAHNVASVIGKEYKEYTVLLDMDTTFGTVGLAYNLETAQTLHALLLDPERLDETLFERHLAEVTEHLKLLIAPALLEAEENLKIDALDFLMEISTRSYAYTILDFPRRWSPWAKQLMQDIDELIIVSPPDLAGMRDTKNLIEWFKPRRSENMGIHVVLNQVGASKKTELNAKDFESATGQKPLAVFPYDIGLFGEAANNGQMLTDVNPKSKTLEPLYEMCHHLTGYKLKSNTVSISDRLKQLSSKIAKKEAAG